MKMIRSTNDLQAHIHRLRKPNETDKEFAARIGVHVNTLTKLKHGSGMFQVIPSMSKLGLKIVYEVTK